MHRALGLAAAVLFLTAAFTPLPNLVDHLLMRSFPGPQPGDAIVALGAGVSPEGILGDSSLRRAVHAMRLYRRGLAPLVVFSGPRGAAGPPEAEVRAALARELGLPAGAILTEATARTTREEALRIAGLLRPRGVRRIILVTETQHMIRAQRLFEEVGFAVSAALPDDGSPPTGLGMGGPEDQLMLARYVIGEFIARLYYRAAGYL